MSYDSHPTEAFIDAQALLRKKKFDEMIFVLQHAHNLHPDHIGIRIARAVAECLGGSPVAFAGVGKALESPEIRPRDIALSAWILQETVKSV